MLRSVRPSSRPRSARKHLLPRSALVVALLLAPVGAVAQDVWLEEPVVDWELEVNVGDDGDLDEVGETVVGTSTTESDDGEQGIFLGPGETTLSAGYTLTAVATVTEVEERIFGDDIHCRVTWTLTNTSRGPIPPIFNPTEPRISEFSSGVPELNAGIRPDLPLFIGQSADATQEEVHSGECDLAFHPGVRVRFNPEAPAHATLALAPATTPDCLPGDRPAATLLIPHFELDLDDPTARTTAAAIVNAADTCTLTRVTLWTDLAVPTLSFYVYLSPDDVQTVNFRDLFNGDLPDTSGVLGAADCPVLDFDVCSSDLLDSGLSAPERAALAAAHTGAADPGSGLCAGVDHGDSVARGYATVDVVSRCTHAPTVATHQLPEWDAAEGYHAATATSTQNALWGDYFLVDAAGNSAQSESAVPVVADPDRFGAGDYTFYGRYNGFDGSDGRMPLSGRTAVRFLNGGPFDGGTDLLVWRDTRSPEVSPVACGGAPPWAPLEHAGLGLYDEDEFPFQPPSGDLFPWATQRLSMAEAGFPDVVPFGWLDLDLWHDPSTPAQSWVTAVLTAEGRFSVQHAATRRDDLCHQPAVPPAP